MTKIAIDRGTGNFVLSDLAVLRLYMMGCSYIRVVSYGFGDMPSMRVDNTLSGMHAARMLSLKSMLELHEQDHTPKPLSDAPSWVTDCENIQALDRWIQMRGNAALLDERVVIVGADDATIEADAWRADPVLIQMIELIAEDASGAGSDLRVIEIPGGVDWGIVSRKADSEWIQELSIPQCSHRRGSYRKLRTWREAHIMPPIYGGTESMKHPYVLASDVAEEDWGYALATNFCGACPVPENMRQGDSALYPWDYERWFYWRMAQGDDWRERAKSKWWFNHVHG